MHQFMCEAVTCHVGIVAALVGFQALKTCINSCVKQLHVMWA